MNYTKTVPYFKEGDKIDKAAKNLPKKQREAILKVSATQKEQERKDKLSSVGADFKKPTARVDMPALTLEAKKLTAKTIQSQPLAKTFGRDLTEIKKKEPEESWDKLSFGKAFNAADKKGLKTFTWRGNLYTTEKKEDVVNKTEDVKKAEIEAEIKEKPFRVGSRTGYVSDTVEDILNGVNQKEPLTQKEIGSSAYKNYPRTVLEPFYISDKKDHPIIFSKTIDNDGKEVAKLELGNDTYYTRTIHNGDTVYKRRDGSTPATNWRYTFLSAEDTVKKKQAESKKAENPGFKERLEKANYVPFSESHLGKFLLRRKQGGTINKYEQGTKIVGEKKPSWFSQLKEKYSNFITGTQTSSNARDQEDFSNLMNLQFRESQKQQWDAEIKSDIMKMMREAAQQQRDSYDTRETFESKWMKPVETQPTPGTGYGIGRSSIQKNGGTINKYEKGTRGVARTNQEQHALDMTRLPKRNIFQHMLGISPNSYNTGRFYNNASGVKTPETVSRHITPFGRDETLIDKPVSYGNLTSRRIIHKGDTTYTQPNGYETKNPSFINSFTQADKRYWDGLEGVQSKQQGGQVQQQDANKEALVADFVVRYLKTMGVPEEMIVTPEGSVNPEYEEELTAVIKEKDSPEFWLAYQSSPDEVVTQVIRERNPNAATMAKKGTKLQKLSQIRIHLYGGPVAAQVTPEMEAQYRQEQEQRQKPSLWDLNKRAFNSAVNPYMQKVDSTYGAKRGALIDRYHSVGNRVVDSFNTRKNAVVEGYDNLENTGEKVGAKLGRFAGRAIKAAPKAAISLVHPLAGPAMAGNQIRNNWLQRREEKKNPRVYF